MSFIIRKMCGSPYFSLQHLRCLRSGIKKEIHLLQNHLIEQRCLVLQLEFQILMGLQLVHSAKFITFIYHNHIWFFLWCDFILFGYWNVSWMTFNQNSTWIFNQTSSPRCMGFFNYIYGLVGEIKMAAC